MDFIEFSVNGAVMQAREQPLCLIRKPSLAV